MPLVVNILNPFSNLHIVVSGEFWERLGEEFSKVICVHVHVHVQCVLQEMKELKIILRILAWELMIN